MKESHNPREEKDREKQKAVGGSRSEDEEMVGVGSKDGRVCKAVFICGFSDLRA